MTTRFSETLHEGTAQTFEIVQMLADERSDFQSIKIFDTPRNGRVLVLDDIVQLTTRDEFTYSEMLTHVPVFELMARGHIAENILVVGGGDGAIAEEALKHRTVRSVVMAEIDPRVIELSKVFFETVSGPAFADPRLTIACEDAFEYLKRPEAKGRFDVIIADRPDPVGPAEILFADAFYQTVAEALTPHGVAVFQTGTPFYQSGELADTVPQLRRTFGQAGAYYTITPTYYGGPMALTWASNGTHLGTADLSTLTRLYEAVGVPTDYYDPQVHLAAFALPVWMQRIVQGDRHLPDDQTEAEPLASVAQG